MPPHVKFFSVVELQKLREQADSRYLEFLRVPAMSVGLYVLLAESVDPQKPHKEAEMYYVIRGRAHFKAGEEDREVDAGSVIFVSAGAEHRFYDISEDLTVLVSFAPAES
jgi:mannose-6-phosphate isomerase-like protein (cupin superfamily)